MYDASRDLTVTPQFSLEDGMLLIFTPFCQILLGGGGLYKASVLSKHTGWEGIWFGEQGVLWHSSSSVCFATHKALVRGCAEQRPEAIKLLLGFLGTEFPALRRDSWVLAALLDNGGIQELPKLRVSEVKQWEEAKLQPWVDRNRVRGGCRRIQPGLILLFKMPKAIWIQMGEGCGAQSKLAHPSLLAQLFQLWGMGATASQYAHMPPASAAGGQEWDAGKKHPR